MKSKNVLLNGNNISTTIREQNKKILVEVIINDPESKMRVGIKTIDEIVRRESKKHRLNAPLTTEEKILLNL
jgi:hypothetical protein